MTQDRVAKGRGDRRRQKGGAEKASGEAGRAEWRGGLRGARRRGGPSVLWDAAAEWRWARDFEQTRVCVSEAPPLPRLLEPKERGREKEAAAPPALVSVRPGVGHMGRRAGRGAESGGAGGGRRTAPSGNRGWWVVAESGNLQAGGRRAPPRPAVGGRILRVLPLPACTREGVCHPAARPSWRSGGRAPAAVDTQTAWPEKSAVSALGFWEPVLLLCHFVPAPPFPAACRPVLPTPLCMVSSCVSVFLAKPTSQMS